MTVPGQFCFEKGSWTRPPEAQPSQDNEPDRVRICVAGDWAPIRAFAPIMEKNPEQIYGDLLPGLREADLSIVNLEAPLSNTGRAVHKSGAVFKGLKKHVKALDVVPFDAVTLANNHVFDYGVGAFDQTLEALESANIQWTGAGKNLDQAMAPLILEKNHLTLGVVNFSEGEDLTGAEPDKPGVAPWNLDHTEAVIRSLKKKVDVIMVIAHCGLEYIPFPPPYVIHAFERMAQAGADIVIGHHPHVPQGVQVHKGVPIFYSLGNFVFFQPTNLKFRKMGYMVDIEMDKTGVCSAKTVPYVIQDKGLARLRGPGKRFFFNNFKRISLPLQSRITQDQAWHGYLCHYGTSGFLNELESIASRIRTQPEKGAAMLRNRLTCLQHYHHWKDTMTGIVEGRLKDPVEWSQKIICQYLTDTGPIGSDKRI